MAEPTFETTTKIDERNTPTAVVPIPEKPSKKAGLNMVGALVIVTSCALLSGVASVILGTIALKEARNLESVVAKKADSDKVAKIITNLKGVVEADQKYVDEQLKLKADAFALVNKADYQYVDDQLALKADSDKVAKIITNLKGVVEADHKYVDEQLKLKADASALDKKADKTDVEAQLQHKSSHDWVRYEIKKELRAAKAEARFRLIKRGMLKEEILKSVECGDNCD